MTNLVDVLPQVLEKSENGKIKWEELSSGNSFITRLQSGVLEVNKTQGMTKLFFRNEAGRVLESTSYMELQNPFDGMLEKLYEYARRQALKVDDTLDELKNELDKL